MAISNTASGLRPGICTSTTRPSAPYEGQMIYETDTDLTYLWNGASWTQVSGSTAVGNSGLVYVSGGSFTTATFFEITGFSSLYSSYQVVIQTRRVDTAGMGTFTAVLRNGSTPITTGYYEGAGSASYLGSIATAYTRNNQSDWIWGNSDSGVATSLWNYTVHFASTAGCTFTMDGFSVGEAKQYFGGGTNNTTAAFDRIRIAYDYGTHTGKWTMLGVRQ
jgi:hypothetical protein